MNGDYFILEPSRALNYILAGNALFTAHNIKTSNHFTFKVTINKLQTSIFNISVLRGYNEFMKIGLLSKFDNEIRNLDNISPNVTSLLAFRYVFGKLEIGTMPSNIFLYRYNICGGCGRVLTRPESILDGLGEECKRRLEKTRFVHPELYKK